jgi:hypothetical protein
MSIKIADLKVLQIPEGSVFKLRDPLPDPTSDHFEEAFEEAMSTATPVNATQDRWGEVVAHGESVARIYSSGFVARLTMAEFSFDPAGTPEDIADAIVKQTGGELRRT